MLEFLIKSPAVSHQPSTSKKASNSRDNCGPERSVSGPGFCLEWQWKLARIWLNCSSDITGGWGPGGCSAVNFSYSTAVQWIFLTALQCSKFLLLHDMAWNFLWYSFFLLWKCLSQKISRYCPFKEWQKTAGHFLPDIIVTTLQWKRADNIDEGWYILSKI